MTIQKPEKWFRTREGILFVTGLVICMAEFVSAEIIGDPFHYEFLVLGAAFCGVSLFQGSDRRGQ